MLVPVFANPIAPEELTMQHVRAVPSVLVPQFHDEALQTHLFSRSSLANPPLRQQRDESFETKKWTKNGERQFCVYLAIHPSRSLSTNDLQSIHHEVLTNLRPRCPSLTKSLNPRLAIHPSRSKHDFSKMSIHHEVFQPTPCYPSITKYSQIFCLWRYSDVWLLVNSNLPLPFLPPAVSSTTRSNRCQPKTKDRRSGDSTGVGTTRARQKFFSRAETRRSSK